MKKSVVILDEEDIKRLSAILRWNGKFMKLSNQGDIEIVKDDNKDRDQTVGYACGLDNRNKKIIEILLGDGDVDVLVWDKQKQEQVKVDAKPHEGVLDLRDLVVNP